MQPLPTGGDGLGSDGGLGQQQGRLFVEGASLQHEIRLLLGALQISGRELNHPQLQPDIQIIRLEFLRLEQEGNHAADPSLIGINQGQMTDGGGVERFNLEYVHVLDFRFVVMACVEMGVGLLLQVAFLFLPAEEQLQQRTSSRAGKGDECQGRIALTFAWYYGRRVGVATAVADATSDLKSRLKQNERRE